MSTEVWKPIPGWTGLYEVSDQGRVRSLGRPPSAGRRRVVGKVLVSMPMSDGHMRLHLCDSGRTVTRLVHQLVLEAFVGPRPKGFEGCHNDGDPANNALTNLRWDSRSANCLDRVSHGTHQSSKKTTCPRGHLLAAPNLVPSGIARGYRQCVACGRTHAHCRRRGIPFDPAIADEKYAEIIAKAVQP